MSTEQTPQPMTNDAHRQISGPATGLLITGILGALLSVTGFIVTIIGTGISSIVVDHIPDRYEELIEGTVGIGISFVGILVAAFIIYASLKMKELTQWELSVAASVLAMIPCISPCCIVGLPIGIWCLVVLLRPEVRAAFH